MLPTLFLSHGSPMTVITDTPGHRFLAGLAASLPRKAPKKPRPTRYGVHFHLTNHQNQLLLRTRPQSGLLGGMVELPGPIWRERPWSPDEAVAEAPQRADWRHLGQIEHDITHFHLKIDVYSAQLPTIQAEGFLRHRQALGDEALPTVMKKCLKLAEAYLK